MPKLNLPRSVTDFWGDTYVPLADAARLLGVHAETVRKWIEAGKVKGKQWRGVWWYVLVSEVERLANERKPQEAAHE